MPDVYEKVGDSSLQVTKIPAPVVIQYDLPTLRKQEAQLLRDQARVVSELAEVRNLIAQAVALGVKDPTVKK